MVDNKNIKIVNMELPSSCNISCEFCYLPKTGGSLKLSDLENIIDEFPNAQIFHLGGGEPFLYNGLLRVIGHIQNSGNKSIVIMTNATYIPGEIMDLPEKSRSGITIQVSLHAGNSELYKKVTKEDKFDGVLWNIRKLKQRYSVVINTVVYQRNYDSVKDILKIAQEFGVPIRINLAIPAGRGKNIDILNEKQLKSLKSLLFVKRATGFDIESPLLSIDVKNNCIVNSCVLAERFYGLEKDVQCPVDLGIKAYIDPDGNRFACEYLTNGDAHG